MDENEAFEYVKSTLKKEKITPYHSDELEIVKSIGACISCPSYNVFRDFFKLYSFVIAKHIVGMKWIKS
ncbi:unnamed protein product [marine sediment metagenome]|uniref:Uncharacterized protein n=1 Tax=marine sediment metagenome TaxID=412755 RepID=X1DAM7_9ZZZZ